MITRSLISTPPPIQFVGAKPGAVMMIFFDTGRTGGIWEPIGMFEVKCDKFIVTEVGISIIGVIVGPKPEGEVTPATIGRLALIDIDWDTGPGYSGQIVIAGCTDEEAAGW